MGNLLNDLLGETQGLIDTRSKRMSIAGNGPLSTGTIKSSSRLSSAWWYNGNSVDVTYAEMDDYQPVQSMDDYQPVQGMDEFLL